MTCSLDLRKCRLRELEYPSAFSSTARRCFLPWTARLTRAMTPSPSSSSGANRGSGAAQHALDVLLVAADDLGAAAEPAGTPTGLLLEQVRPEGLAALDLPGARDLEALRRAPVCLDLRHLSQAPWVGVGSDAGAGSEARA